MTPESFSQHAHLWRGNQTPPAVVESVPSGFSQLDALLPGAGWPLGAITEILADSEGSGALNLIIPVLVQMSALPRWLVWIAPPHIPYAPALVERGIDISRILLVRPKTHQETLWALEQALRSGVCSAVLAWPGLLRPPVLRRLQLAAASSRTLVILFQHSKAAANSSPAALRIQLAPTPRGLAINILKRRGSWPTGPVFIDI